jgi:hypothetical protein
VPPQDVVKDANEVPTTDDELDRQMLRTKDVFLAAMQRLRMLVEQRHRPEIRHLALVHQAEVEN